MTGRVPEASREPQTEKATWLKQTVEWTEEVAKKKGAKILSGPVLNGFCGLAARHLSNCLFARRNRYLLSKGYQKSFSRLSGID